MPALLIGPLGKILGVGLLIVLLLGIGEWHGREAIQQRWDAAIARQAMDAADTVIKGAENTARVEKDLSQHEQLHDERVRIVTKERIKYVEGPATQCVVTPEFERVFDLVSRLHDAGTDGLPAAGDTAGAVAEPSGPRLTDAAVLAAYQGAVSQLYALDDTYRALVEWVRSSHEIEKEGAGR